MALQIPNEQRPKLALSLSASDKILETVAAIGAIGVWLLAIYFYSTLPERIPAHYDFHGNIDRYGGKGMIWCFPVLATGLYSLLTLINRYPHIFNYPVPITMRNSLQQYTYATRLVRYLKTILIVFFDCMIVQTAYDATHTATFSMGYDVLALLLSLAILLVGYFRMALKAR